MFKFKKILVIIFNTVVLYYALVSPNLLPNVTIAVKDALIISIFVIFTGMCIRLIALTESSKLEKKVLIQNSQLSAIINVAPYAIYLKKPDGKIILSNKYHADLLNSTPDELVGKSSYELFIDTEQFKNEDKEIFEKKACTISESKLNTIHGNSSWYRLSKTPIINDDGIVESILVILQNIDREKELEDRKILLWRH